MTFDETVAHFGSRKELARRLGIDVAAVAMWRIRGGTVPLSVQWQIELGTRGKLKADEPPFLK